MTTGSSLPPLSHAFHESVNLDLITATYSGAKYQSNRDSSKYACLVCWCHISTVAQPRILFGRGQSMPSSVTDVVLSPTVPSVYFLTIED